MDINFDDIPQELKIKILSINEENNFKEHQSRFNIVLNELEGIQDEIYFYYDFEEMNEEMFEEVYGLSFFLLDYLHDISNLEY